MRAPRQHERPAAARAMIGLVIGALTAAAIAVAVSPSDVEPVVAAPVPAAAPVITPTAPVVMPAPARTAEASATRSAAPKTTAKAKGGRTAEPKTKTRSSTSCAEAAMQDGRFDPSCSMYQGYLDPGTAAGREPTSGEIQAQYACEQGLIPRPECG